MSDQTGLPILYSDLAEWWPALSSPEDYAEEADFYRRAILSAGGVNVRTMVEFGSGGGNNASHLKKHFTMTLVDISPRMLAVSRSLNPECEHIQGDMRSVRLGSEFDAVFIHDAIVYMTSEDDLRSAIETAHVHCKPGGVALFAPDHTRETFKPSTSHGGHDRGQRSLRYLEWKWDPDPSDSTYVSFMVYVMRTRDGTVRCAEDKHVCGLFGQEDWMRLMAEVGFSPRCLPFEHSEAEPGSAQVLLGLKPARSTGGRAEDPRP